MVFSLLPSVYLKRKAIISFRNNINKLHTYTYLLHTLLVAFVFLENKNKHESRQEAEFRLIG